MILQVGRGRNRSPWLFRCYLVRNDSPCWDDPPKKWTWTSPTPPPSGVIRLTSLHPNPLKFVRWRMGGMVCNRAEGCQCFWSLATFKKRIYLWEFCMEKWSKLSFLLVVLFFIWDEIVPSLCGQVLNGNKSKVICEPGGPSQLDLSS